MSVPAAPLSPEPPTRAARAWRSSIPPLLVAAVAVGYVGADVAGALDDPAPSALPPLLQAGLVLLQAIVLTARHRMPAAVFTTVVALDLALLATGGGDLGIGALAVMIAAYVLTRRLGVRAAAGWLAAAAAATAVTGTVAMLAASAPPIPVVLVAAARVALLYALPAAAADYVGGRERLARALRERAALLERERIERVDRERRAERVALARELHDIAGHHLTGIIVSAQAASALTPADPGRAREMMRSVQDDARTALADLRRTVGLLRDDDAREPGGEPASPPAIGRIPSLVDEARARGQDVSLDITGDVRAVSVLSDTAAYRMVQESLANAVRHAPGAACAVSVQFGATAVEVAVRNTATDGAARDGREPRRGDAFGLAGMAERAELVGARLTAGPTDDGGWCNRMIIPLAPVAASPGEVAG